MTPELVSRDLRTVVSSVEILDDSRYRIESEEHEIDESARHEDSWSGSSPAPSPLAAALANDLYTRLYFRPGPVPGRLPDSVGIRRHLAELSGANSGKGTWEPGWRIQRAEIDGEVLAERHGVRYRVPRSLVRCGEDGPRPSDRCRVRIPEESQWLLPGYYLVRGDAEEAADADGLILRFYWHLRSAGAVTWMRALTTGLNRKRIPFRLKALRAPHQYRRADAGVLYLEQAHYAAAREEISRSWHEARDELRPEVPLFTARLARGLGLAEGAADYSSFGQQRCQLIAAALARAFEEGRVTVPERSAAVAAGFRAAGLDPERPHLAPGSSACYESIPVRDLAQPGRRLSIRPPSFGAAARRIADGLCREAYWHDGRCNWIGLYADRKAADERRSVWVAPLPADLYRGAAGIALFLAELQVTTGEVKHRQAALGAIRQALAAIGKDPRSRPLSFWVGQLGVAWATGRVATALGDEVLRDRASELLAALLAATHGEEHLLDVISGNAGAIPVLLELHRATGEVGCLATAVALGQELVDAGNRAGDVWTWSNERSVGGSVADPPLTGLAHGAAGLGLALFELFAATRRRTFLNAARGAFAYEDALFDRHRRNWPDLRGVSATGSASKFGIAWCHGAPGIVLSRLRALVIDPGRAQAYETAAQAGVATTLRALREGAAGAEIDTSLCHGLCGLIDIALISSEVLGETEPREAAKAAMECLLDRHAKPGDWPSGVLASGRDPSLLLGQAGVGYTLMRLSDPRRTPSVLLPGKAPVGKPA